MNLRTRAGLTQLELARKLSDAFGKPVTDKRISRWERGAHEIKFNPTEMLTLCQILGCTLEELAIAHNFSRSQHQEQN